MGSIAANQQDDLRRSCCIWAFLDAMEAVVNALCGVTMPSLAFVIVFVCTFFLAASLRRSSHWRRTVASQYSNHAAPSDAPKSASKERMSSKAERLVKMVASVTEFSSPVTRQVQLCFWALYPSMDFHCLVDIEIITMLYITLKIVFSVSAPVSIFSFTTPWDLSLEMPFSVHWV